MARYTRRADTVTPPSLSLEVAKKLLSALLERGKAIATAQPIPEPSFDTWENQCIDTLTKAFGSDSDYVHQFKSAGYPTIGTAMVREPSPQWYDERRKKVMGVKIQTLEAFIHDVLDFQIQTSAPAEPVHQGSLIKQTKDVFIVHGHDEAAKSQVARALDKLKLNPIILHEMPDEGMTIIEKLMKHAETAAFAVVILTPDDFGGSKKEAPKQAHRARQNVIFELGLFIGLLGRNRVCPLYVQGVELPSDFGSVGYTPLDEHGGWMHKLAKELRAAGLKVDANDLL